MNQPIQDTFLDGSVNVHDVPADSPANDYPTPLDPLVPVDEPLRPSGAEQARTILAGASVGTLASLTADGSPWASVVQYAVMHDGTPVLSVSTLALHGRNLQADQRASLAVAAPVSEGRDPGDSGRVTVAGWVEEPEGEERERAEAAYYKAVPAAEIYNEFGDFNLWALRIERIRWVGGFGRMASAQPSAYAAAQPDPVADAASYAVRHMNEDHADALLAMARAFTGHTDAVAATALRADRYGLDLGVETPRGKTPARVNFLEPVVERDGLRKATVDLTKRAYEIAG
ncbi:MAG: pyridoxamine 5'-phosphate oxidase family protein [Actinobacteria bacterium]|nr:pyridoxamine 5'-phosphate oxidase family protein [Actinomycetota bacterium]